MCSILVADPGVGGVGVCVMASYPLPSSAFFL